VSATAAALEELPTCPLPGCGARDDRIIEHLTGHAKAELVDYIGRPLIRRRLRPVAHLPELPTMRVDLERELGLMPGRPWPMALPRRGSYRLDADQRAELHRRAAAGESDGAVARLIGCSPFTVLYHRRHLCTCALS
jgi:hypothetical protein